MNKVCLLTIGWLLAGSFYLVAQTVKIPLSMERWDTEGANVTPEKYMGKESILLSSGIIYAKDIDFLDGIIEADISFPQQRGFPGIAFRLQDRNNFENFYVRPHQSGNPDATQYTPVFNGLAGWQLYHGEGYSAAFTYNFNRWHHIKIDVHGRQAEIYLDDMQKPLVKVTELKRDPKAGKIGLLGGADVHFANLQYTPKQATVIAAIPVPANGAGGLVTRWQVSNVVSNNLFENAYRLTPEMKKAFTWTTQSSEPSGTINLAKFGQITDSARVMVARITIESVSDQVKELSFGFSDFVAVYLDDNILYVGADNFMSRDYRFLGTVGFYDKLYLQLKKGKHELWFVVAEQFGGWGLKAKFENMEGITIY